MWEERESQKPKNQRRPVPQAPSAQTGGASWNDINKQHAAAMTAFEQQAMCECPNCGRTFLEDRLAVHSRSCKSGSPSKPPPGKLSSTGQISSQPKAGISRRNDSLKGTSETNKAPAKSIGSTGPVRSRNAIDEQALGPRRGPADQYQSNEPDNDMDRVACRSCGRKFAPDRVDKHQRVCLGPDKPAPKTQPISKPKKKSAGDPLWKRQHMDFINSIRYARKVTSAQKQGIDVRTLAPPPQQFADPSDDYVQCPFCDRRYAPVVAERHIPKCKDIINKPKAPPQKASVPARSSVPQRQPIAAQRQAPQAVQPKQPQRSSQQQLAKPSLQAQAVRLKPSVREEAKKPSRQPIGRQVADSCLGCGESMLAKARFCGYCGTRK